MRAVIIDQHNTAFTVKQAPKTCFSEKNQMSQDPRHCQIWTSVEQGQLGKVSGHTNKLRNRSIDLVL